MKNADIKNLKSTLIIALVGIVFGVGVFGASLVHRGRLMAEHSAASVCHTQDCENQAGDPVCASSCLSAFENSMQTLPPNLSYFLFFIFLFSAFFITEWNFVRENSFKNLKLFIRQSRERFILSYFAQLGSWLALFGKRDPSQVFASI